MYRIPHQVYRLALTGRNEMLCQDRGSQILTRNPYQFFHLHSRCALTKNAGQCAIPAYWPDFFCTIHSYSFDDTLFYLMTCMKNLIQEPPLVYSGTGKLLT